MTENSKIVWVPFRVEAERLFQRRNRLLRPTREPQKAAQVAWRTVVGSWVMRPVGWVSYSFKSRRSIFPVALTGSSLRNSTKRGTL